MKHYTRIREKIREAGEWWPSGPHFELAEAYLRAAWQRTVSRQHWLYEVISRCGLFERIADRSFPDFRRQAMVADRRHRFLRCLTIPAGDADELTGQVLYWVLRLQSWFRVRPRARLPDNLRRVAQLTVTAADLAVVSRDFRYIADRYAEVLGIPRQRFSVILGVYVKLWFAEFFRQREPVNQAVFYAANLVEILRRPLWTAYRRRISQFRRKLRLGVQSFSDTGSWSVATRDRIRQFGERLLAEPLFNCVFHSEVYGGHRRLKCKMKQGRPSRVVDGLTIAYAKRVFAEHWRGRRKPTLDNVLTPERPLRHEVREALAHAKGRGDIYAYLAPLMTALVHSKGFVYTPQLLKEAYRKYCAKPELASLDNHLREQRSSLPRGRQFQV